MNGKYKALWINEDKFSSFELFRRNLINPEILMRYTP